MRTMKYLKLLLLALLVATALSACNKHSGLQIGDPAPVVTLNDFNGKPVTLPEAYKGKVMLVRFWSLECGFCDKEMLFSFGVFLSKVQRPGIYSGSDQ